jgi:hypothetical protein
VLSQDISATDALDKLLFINMFYFQFKSENPCVGGSIPPLATIPFNDLSNFPEVHRIPLQRQFLIFIKQAL